jgi:hypothetical protein
MSKSKKKRNRTGRVPVQRNVTAIPAASRTMPMRDDQRATPVNVDGDNEPSLVVPTIAMRSICAVARTESLELEMAEDVERRLAATGKHMLVGMQRVRNTDGTDFIRARTLLQMNDLPPGRPFEVWIDFPTRYIGMLMDAAERKAEPQTQDDVAATTVEYEWLPQKPVWVGSHSFAPVWNQSVRLAQDSYPRRVPNGDGERIDPRGLLAMSALSLMKDAHLVKVEPEQVQVLPDWDELANLWDYAQDVVLPFDKLYLDFEGPGGFAPTHMMEGALPGKYDVEIELRGALVWREGSGRLVVTPVAWPRTWIFKGEGDIIPYSKYEAVGSVVFGSGSVYESVMDVAEMTMRLGGSQVYAKPLGISTAAITPGNLQGYVHLPVASEMIDRVEANSKLEEAGLLAGPDAKKQLVAGWAAVALSAAARTLAALSILEADEVELIDAPIEAKKKAKAERLGHQISQVVFIRPGKRYLNPNPASGELMEYSHRFWVRAHTKHFQVGTRVADSRPDLVKACHRCGSCRRVPTKAFIKGPPDRPLVPKSLAVRRKERVTELPKREREPDSYMAPGV